MVRLDDNIRDDELRVLGTRASAQRRSSVRWYHVLAAVAAVIAVAVAILLILFLNGSPMEEPPAEDFYDSQACDSSLVQDPSGDIAWLGEYSDSSRAYTERIEVSVNDIPLDIFIPHNAKPRLFVGSPDQADRNVVFTTQAADIRADNGKINGAFVLEGKPLAWGLSKKGFCGIIGDKVMVGVADNSPLFEEATEKDGYFFRQYALVDNGVLVENEPKGKTYRKAICDRNGEIIIVMSQTRESFHDFAQALVDFGVRNAVYLVGSTSFGYYRDADGQLTTLCEKQSTKQKFENHIQWVLTR